MGVNASTKGAAWFAGALASLVLVGPAHGANWPLRAIRMITSAPGSPFDVAMRGFAAPVGQALGQPIVVEHRPGGNFIPIAEACLRGGADGHTLCTADIYMISINPHIFPKLSYSPLRDFQPITHFGHLKGGLIVHPSVPAGDPAELFAFAKAKPGAIAFGTPGPATMPTMMIEYLKRTAGVSFVNVPYKSFFQAASAVISGEVSVGTVAIGQAITFARAGRVKLLAATSRSRSSFAPSLPSLSEYGVALDLDSYGGVLAPTGTPREIVARLNAEFNKAMLEPGFKEKVLQSQGFEHAPPAGGTPEEFGAFLKRQDEKFAKLIPFLGGLTDIVKP